MTCFVSDLGCNATSEVYQPGFVRFVSLPLGDNPPRLQLAINYCSCGSGIDEFSCQFNTNYLYAHAVSDALEELRSLICFSRREVHVSLPLVCRICLFPQCYTHPETGKTDGI